MATSRREPDARINRTTRTISPGLKPTEPVQGLRRAKSVPSSPDRKLSTSPAASSSNACRPSSSFNTRTASSRSTFGSASSPIHGKALHTQSSMTTAKPANTMRGKGDKSGGSSLWPAALAHSHSSKDMNTAAKSVSTLHKSNLSPRPGVEKMAVSSSKQRTQRAIPGALLAGGKGQGVSSFRAPSIEEHLQERLPDPVELKHVDVTAYAISQDDPNEPS